MSKYFYMFFLLQDLQRHLCCAGWCLPLQLCGNVRRWSNRSNQSPCWNNWGTTIVNQGLKINLLGIIISILSKIQTLEQMPTSLEERSVAAVVEAKNKKNSLGANRSIFITFPWNGYFIIWPIQVYQGGGWFGIKRFTQGRKGENWDWENCPFQGRLSLAMPPCGVILTDCIVLINYSLLQHCPQKGPCHRDRVPIL